MIFIFAIPVFVIASLLFWAGWRKCAMAAVGVPLVFAAGISALIYSNQNPEIGEGLTTVDWLPSSARDINFIRSYSFTAYEFTIDQDEFLRFAESKNWPMKRIETEKSIVRYLLALEWRGRKVEPADLYATVNTGIFYEFRQSNGGGVTALYDSTLKRAFVTTRPR